MGAVPVGKIFAVPIKILDRASILRLTESRQSGWQSERSGDSAARLA